MNIILIDCKRESVRDMVETFLGLVSVPPILCTASLRGSRIMGIEMSTATFEGLELGEWDPDVDLHAKIVMHAVLVTNDTLRR